MGATGRCPEQPRETVVYLLDLKDRAHDVCRGRHLFNRNGGGSGRCVARGSGKKVYETPTGRARTVDPHVVERRLGMVRRLGWRNRFGWLRMADRSCTRTEDIASPVEIIFGRPHTPRCSPMLYEVGGSGGRCRCRGWGGGCRRRGWRWDGGCRTRRCPCPRKGRGGRRRVRGRDGTSGCGRPRHRWERRRSHRRRRR